MKLTGKERKTLNVIRKLDSRQRERVINDVKRQVLANDITQRIGKLRRLRVVSDATVAKAYGRAPMWKIRPSG